MAQTFATVADIPLYGMPATALGTLTTAQQQACLDAAAAEMNTYFRARYGEALPFISFGTELIEKNVIIAKYKMLMVRGFNPNAAADKNIRDDYLSAITWCEQVRDQKIHPDVTYHTTTEGVQPLVFSATPRGY